MDCQTGSDRHLLHFTHGVCGRQLRYGRDAPRILESGDALGMESAAGSGFGILDRTAGSSLEGLI